MLYREALESANLMKISLVSATAVLAICLLALANTAHTAQAASFPQNGKIAFQSSDRIYAVEPDGSNQRPLTPGLYPNWSPDGTEIVFQGSAREISVMSANGSDIRSITHEANERIVGYWPAWSADGTVVAFSDTRLVKTGQGGYLVYDIFMLGLDDSEQTNLTNTPKIDEWDADFSPDGSQICFTRSEPWVPEPKHSGIYVMDIAHVTNARVDVDRPDWQPLTPKSRSLEVRPADTGGPSLLLVASALLFSGGVVFYAGVKRKM